ncbi:uncharacterized protein LOC130891508 [Diorhabda carinulata]|uniref:uncharacterized protein LOC130891508 n=1 Tax=Diorhabda carinulata TaxID=1163345 RepID=UPI0025A2C611|nr:uncharacterized protein LOC130891508 [Diorhabda carinulata]
MWRYLVPITLFAVYVTGQGGPRSGDELVSTVLDNCIEMDCVKQNVLGYLNNVLHIQSDVQNTKNLDAAILKRVRRVLDTHEFRLRVPEPILEQTDIVYNPKNGLDIVSNDASNEARGLGLKKKLLFPILLLLKLKKNLLQPLFIKLSLIKATKALILSKLAIIIVIGFVAYQLLGKSGMPLPMMSMAPAEPPAPLYGAPPAPSPAPPSSYEPGWEPNTGGPYQRVWTVSNEPAQNLAYSAYYPGSSASSSTSRP